MTDFIREVDEEFRQDKFKQVLNRYWYLIAIFVVLVLGGVGAWKAFDYLRTQKADTASGSYLAALDLARDGKGDEAIAALKGVETDGTPGYRLLARFRLAGETGIKDPAAGAKMFDDLAADPTVDPALQSVARLRAGLLLVDSLSYADFKARLEPLADANSPVRNAAREILTLAALKANQTEDADRYLAAIETDPTTTINLRQRAGALHALIPAPGAVAPPPAPAPASVPAPAQPAASASPAASAPPAPPASMPPAPSPSVEPPPPTVAIPAAPEPTPPPAPSTDPAPPEPAPGVGVPAPSAPASPVTPPGDAPAK